MYMYQLISKHYYMYPAHVQPVTTIFHTTVTCNKATEHIYTIIIINPMCYGMNTIRQALPSCPAFKPQVYTSCLVKNTE